MHVVIVGHLGVIVQIGDRERGDRKDRSYGPPDKGPTLAVGSGGSGRHRRAPGAFSWSESMIGG
jgi:hypothetical protein